MARRDELIRGYAQALFGVAEAEGVQDEVEDELFRFARTLERESKLREALTDQALPMERKRAVLGELLGERANPRTLALLAFIVESGRGRDLAPIVDRVAELAAAQRNRAVAEVRTAVPLTTKQQERLRTALSEATDKDVELRIVVDESVVGGLFVRVGDQVFDGTVKRRLELAREHLSGV